MIKQGLSSKQNKCVNTGKLVIWLAGGRLIIRVRVPSHYHAFYFNDVRKEKIKLLSLTIFIKSLKFNFQVNGIGCVLMLAVLSFALLTMALYDYKQLVQMWLYMSCILIIFGVFASFLVYVFCH